MSWNEILLQSFNKGVINLVQLLERWDQEEKVQKPSPEPENMFRNTVIGSRALWKEEPKIYPDGILQFKKESGAIVDTNIYSGYQYACKVHLEEKPFSTIHQVLNSKSEIFTVSDTTNYGVIHHFEFDSAGIYADCGEGNGILRHVDVLSKGEKKPLFKTSDGFELPKGTDVFMTDKEPKNNWIGYCEIESAQAESLMTFKEKSNAEAYIANNKKSISYKELVEYVNGATHIYERGGDWIRKEMIIQHFKPKPTQ